ncbi:MAG: S-layer homology domain-containing protein [Oscillospiraceae bacterium]|jgi:uncharacterized repeat protein (TIGR02543 family)|nr:S-layer homology domain-containing protein [Oscillospiraceae bacterium]
MTAFYIFYIVVVGAILFLFFRGSLPLFRMLRAQRREHKKGLWKGVVILSAWAVVITAVLAVTAYFLIGTFMNRGGIFAESGSGDFFHKERGEEQPDPDRPVFGAPGQGDPGEPEDEGEPDEEYILSFEDEDGGEAQQPMRVRPNGRVTLMPMPDRNDNAFYGWYADGERTERVLEVTMDSDKTVYASWAEKSENPLHLPYLLKDGDGSFDPYGGVTRGDMVVLFSLMAADGETVSGGAAVFYDSGETDGYDPLIAVMRERGIINGFPDNTFRPAQNASRAELITVCVRMARLLDERDGLTRDITRAARAFDEAMPWAEDSVRSASRWGWLDYMDDAGNYHGGDVEETGPFPLGGDVTRMEAAVIINRLLRRECDKAYADARGGSGCADVPPDMWARYDIIEASTAHTYTLTPDGGERWRSVG